MQINQAIVLAAGIGKRLRPLTLTTPKPLLPIQGKPILESILRHLQQHGVKKIIVNTHYLADQIHSYLREAWGNQILVSYEPDLLETGGAVSKVLGQFSDKAFFAVNADIWWQESRDQSLLQSLESVWNDATMDALLALISKDQAIEFTGEGDYHLKSDSTLQYRTPNNAAPYIFSGVRILHPRLFHNIEPGFLPQPVLFHKAEAQQRLYGLVHPEKWCDIGTPAAYQALQDYLSA